MAVIEQSPYVDDNGNERAGLIKHCSDSGMMIVQIETGTEYVEAIDTVPCRFTYTESENPIPEEPESEETEAL